MPTYDPPKFPIPATYQPPAPRINVADLPKATCRECGHIRIARPLVEPTTGIVIRGSDGNAQLEPCPCTIPYRGPGER